MVDFRQFVLASWNLSTLSYDGMCQFVYDLYHSTASEDNQFMLLPEITLLVRDLHDKQLEISPNLQEIMSEVRRMDERQHVDYASYKALCNQYKFILFPAFLLQERLRATLFWGKTEAKLLGSRSALACKTTKTNESPKRSASDEYTPLMELLDALAVDNGSILKGLVRKDNASYDWSDVKMDDRAGPSKETRSRSSGKPASSGHGSPSNDAADRGSSASSVSKRALRMARESIFGGQWSLHPILLVDIPAAAAADDDEQPLHIHTTTTQAAISPPRPLPPQKATRPDQGEEVRRAPEGSPPSRAPSIARWRRRR